MTADIQINKDHPANSGVLGYLGRANRLSAARDAFSCSPESVEDPYYNLGTHPELVERLWDRITEHLPVRCNWVVYGVPVLVRPETGVLFGFAHGTLMYALRLPPSACLELTNTALAQATRWADESAIQGDEREHYLAAQAGHVWEFSGGSTFDITTVGDDWVFGRFLRQETEWCLEAYEYAT